MTIALCHYTGACNDLPSRRPFSFRPPLAVVALALCAVGCVSSGGPPRGSLAANVAAIAQRRDALVAVAYKNFGTGVVLSINEDESFHAASTMKVPVMMALFQAVDAGEMKLDAQIPVRNSFRSLVDASPYTLDPKEDGDPDLYQAVGQSRTLEELIRRMITKSSNLATNLLVDRIGASRAVDLLRSLGAYRMQILRGVEDQKAFDSHLNNTATAKDLLLALSALVEGDAFSASSRAKMIEILKEQEFNEKIPAYLPKGIPIAHKTGDITGFHHDAGIVFPPGEAPYVLVVLTSGFQNEKKANQRIAEISRLVWEGRKELPAP
jgi:beta-lactamase class A